MKILVVKPKSLTEEQKQELSKTGLIVIEHKKPEEVRVIDTFSGATSDDVFMSAVDAVFSSTSDMVKVKFANQLLSAIQKRADEEKLKRGEK